MRSFAQPALAKVGEDDGEYDDESEESGFFDGFGDYDAWCAKQDGHVLDSDGYIVGGECDEGSDGYSELGGYPSEEEAEPEELSAKDWRAFAKECGEDQRRGATVSLEEIAAEINGGEYLAAGDMDDVRAQLRQEMGEATRSGQLLADAFGIGGADSDEERTSRRALQVMALGGSLPMGIFSINPQSGESSACRL